MLMVCAFEEFSSLLKFKCICSFMWENVYSYAMLIGMIMSDVEWIHKIAEAFWIIHIEMLTVTQMFFFSLNIVALEAILLNARLIKLSLKW